MQQEEREGMGGSGWEWKGISCTDSAAGESSKCIFTPKELAGAWICSKAGFNFTAVQGSLSYLSTASFAPYAGLLTTSRNSGTSDILPLQLNDFLSVLSATWDISHSFICLQVSVSSTVSARPGMSLIFFSEEWNFLACFKN